MTYLSDAHTASGRGLLLAATLLMCLVIDAHAQLVHGVSDREFLPVDAAEQWISEVRLELNPEGQWVTVTNSFVQLGDGLNYFDRQTSSWLPSHPELELVPGGAIGLRTHQKAFFSPELNDPDGTVRLWTDESEEVFRASMLALSYRDAATGREEILAVVKETEGEFFPPSSVIYRNAFDRISADVLYTFRSTGVEQDVVLLEALPDPEEFGMLPETTRLRVITEVFEAPAPVRIPYLVAAVEDPGWRALIAEPDWIAERVDFGAYRLAQSRAFAWLEDGEGAEDLELSTRWVEDPEGRVALVEEVEYLPLVPFLDRLAQPEDAPRRQRAAVAPTLEAQRLMAASAAASSRADREPSALLPRRPGAAWALLDPARTLLVASQPPRRHPSLVLDWRTESGTLSDYTFRGDETYFISNSVTCTGSLTIFEGGTVIKYATNTTLTVQTPVDWQGSLFRPVVLTGRDDPSVGQLITPTNALVGPFATKALVLDAGTNRTFDIRHARIAHARLGVEILGRTGHILSHLQFVNCDKGISGAGTTYHLRNALFHHVKTNLLQTSASTARLEQVSVNTAVRFNDNTTVFLTNGVLAAVTTAGSYTANSVSTFSTTAAAFQEFGAGRSYLLADSAARDTGTLGIHPVLRQELRTLTTDPPVLLSASFSTDTVLHPTARRDTDQPDRGYHYPPIDYVLSGLNLTNATLVLTNGVAVGVYGPKGIVLRAGSRLASGGSPGIPNRLFRFNTVQEVSTNWGSASSSTFAMLEIQSSTPPPIDFRFTEFSHLAVTTNQTTSRSLISASGLPITLSLRDSHARGIYLGVGYATTTNHITSLLNNVFERSYLGFSELSDSNPSTLNVYNNLFARGTVTFSNPESSSTWTIRDNFFESDVATVSGYTTATHNAFRSGLSAFGSSNRTGIVPDFVPGPLGRFYYPNTGASTSLTNLVNTGSRNATNAGLYHFTVRPDQLKETNTVVDIGFHYPAVGPGSDGLLAYWPLNQTSGTLAPDVSPAPTHDGTLVNGPLWTGGRFQGGVQLDGVNDQISVADHASLRLTNAFSIGFWVYKDFEASDFARIVGKGASGNRNYGVWDDTGGSGKVLFQFQNTGGTYYNVTTTQHLTTNRWYHVACTWDGSTGRIYVDGQLDTSGDMLGTPKTSADALFIGYPGWSGALGGVVDEVVLYGRALTQPEIQTLMNRTASDFDGDGIPDYLEDRNGDGVLGTGETHWQQYDGSMSPTASLSVFTPIQP